MSRLPRRGLVTWPLSRRPATPAPRRQITAVRAPHGACVWALLFAALSFYWAAGGTAGTATLARAIREPTLERDGGFVAVLWLTGALKVGAGLLGLALSRPWPRPVVGKSVLVAGWGTGVLLTLYGAAGLVTALLAEVGVTESSDPETVRWYLLLWEPIWLLGGLLFLGAAWRYTALTARPVERA